MSAYNKVRRSFLCDFLNLIKIAYIKNGVRYFYAVFNGRKVRNTAYDGSIKIDTKIDTSGFVEGISKLNAQAKKLSANVSEKMTSVDKNVKKVGTTAKETGEEFEDSFKGAEKQTQETNREVQKLDKSCSGLSFSRVGELAKTGLKAVTGVITTVSAGMGAAGVAASNFGIEFESAFAGVKKTVNATDGELDELRDDIIKMSKEIPQSAASLAEISEAAGQLGIKTQNIKNFTSVMANMGVATNMSSTEAATSLARLANITGMPQTEFDRLGSTVVALGNNLATTESEIVDMSLRLAGAGSQVGMTEDQILAFAGALSSVGVESEAGGTAFSTLMSKMSLAVAQGGDELDQFASVAGMSASEFKTAFEDDAAGAIITFIKGLDQINENGGSAIQILDEMELSDVRMRDALLRAAGASDTFVEALELGADAWKENTALTKEAEQRYETLESKIQLLKNGVGELAIEFKDSIDDGLRGAVDAGIGYVDRLTDAFKDGGLEGAVEEAGNIFAEIATSAAEAAPQMIDTAVSFIEAFTNGIKDNKSQLTSAAKSIVSALVDGMVALLPGQIKKPVKDTVKAIKESFNDGGLKQAINTVSKLIGNCGKTINDVAKNILPPFVKILDAAAGNLDTIIPLATACAAAYKSWQIISAITAMVGTHTAAVTAEAVAENAAAMAAGTAAAAYSAKSIVVSALTGHVGLATAAQWLWNAAMSANPIGLVVVAVAALTAGIAALCLTQEKEQTNTDILVEKSNERMEKLNDERQAYEDLKKAQEQQAEEDILQVDHAKVLYDELSNLVDGNGKVTESNKARADFIVGELNEALGTELELTGNQITGYQNLKDSIDDLVESRKAEILLDANRETYEAALENITTAKEAETQATYDLATAEDELEKYLSDERLAQLPEATQEQMDAWKSWGDYDVAAAKANINTLKDNLHTASEDVKQYTDDIVSYENAMVASKQGNTEKVLEYLGHENDGYTSAKELEEKSAKERREIIGQNYADSLVELDNYVKKYGKSTETHHKDEIQKLQTQAQKARLEAERVGNGIVDGTVTGIDGAKLNLENTLTSLGKNMPNWVAKAICSENPYALGSGLGQDFGQGYADGLNNKVFAAAEAGANIAKAAAAATKRTQQSNSPSKVTRRYGHDYGAGYAIGIEDEKTEAIKASKSLVTAATNALSLSAIPLPNLVDQAKSKLQNASYAVKMKAAVVAQQANITTALTSKAAHTSVNQSDNDKKVILKGDIHTSLQMDTREVGIAITPYVSEELVFNDLG